MLQPGCRCQQPLPRLCLHIRIAAVVYNNSWEQGWMRYEVLVDQQKSSCWHLHLRFKGLRRKPPDCSLQANERSLSTTIPRLWQTKQEAVLLVKALQEDLHLLLEGWLNATQRHPQPKSIRFSQPQWINSQSRWIWYRFAKRHHIR